jgi:hypothetical protein
MDAHLGVTLDVMTNASPTWVDALPNASPIREDAPL